MVKKAYPDFQAVATEMLCQKQFIIGLPTELKKLMYLHASEAKTMTVMAEKCKALMMIQGGPNEACARVSMEESKLDMVLRKVETLSAEVASLKVSGENMGPRVSALQTGQGGFQFRGTCFKCGGYGHMSRYCDRKNSVCELCNNPGHSRSECSLKEKTRCKKCLNVGHGERDCKYRGTLNWQ